MRAWRFALILGGIALLPLMLPKTAPAQGSQTLSQLTQPIKIERGLSNIEKECIECHSKYEPGKVHDWANSAHARANVTCLDCHGAKPTDKDARD